MTWSFKVGAIQKSYIEQNVLVQNPLHFPKIKNYKKFAHSKKTHYLCTRFRKMLLLASIGEMAEWSIATVLKTVVPQGTGGSNPSLSAENV